MKTVHEKLKEFTVDEMAELLLSIVNEESPWMSYLDKKYCKRCEGVIGEDGCKYALCEIDECPHGITEMPVKNEILLWLNAEDADELE